MRLGVHEMRKRAPSVANEGMNSGTSIIYKCKYGDGHNIIPNPMGTHYHRGRLVKLLNY